MESLKAARDKNKATPTSEKPAELSVPFPCWRWAFSAFKLGQLHPAKAFSSHLYNTTKYNTALTFCQLRQITCMILWTKKKKFQEQSFPPIIYSCFSLIQQHQLIFMMILLPGRIRPCSMKRLSMDKHPWKHTLIQITYNMPSVT